MSRLVRALSSSVYPFVIGKNFKIYVQFSCYWKMHLWNCHTLGMIWSLIPQVEQTPKICPPSVIKSIYKKVPPFYFFGGTGGWGRHYALAPLENYVGVYAPSIFARNARKCRLKLVNILNFAKRNIWMNRPVGWGII